MVTLAGPAQASMANLSPVHSIPWDKECSYAKALWQDGEPGVLEEWSWVLLLKQRE